MRKKKLARVSRGNCIVLLFGCSIISLLSLLDFDIVFLFFDSVFLYFDIDFLVRRKIFSVKLDYMGYSSIAEVEFSAEF